ncbi:hypothetical protein HER10_EVM0006644 [Colletotrichum scovillei]|uniref:Uncharacterized protein n=1 Tax=Colletotrichum scovillei TaxID=1209932 RepID=A0A9P7UHL5_9PEZI|nr:uncharacterized protein HER10_EVM0006644 [Colletotrichum scovillei]KAF4776503.1 hypothetical protein HER10_EVM0006644 [Colletotrichum scovillei]KAG7053632.1 hypothetical protein JMJ77_0000717 [Colletotrichum scovillei]KAG7071930.1 hypothetical protein JMJ76_0004795 [Colletotrichum scovillei]KAG7080307.1 hypothetical protein JMJ78_0007404 [Colletotrichum scovillei]
MMEDLRQVDPALPQHREDHSPPSLDKRPIDVDADAMILDDSRLTYSQAPGTQATVTIDPVSSHATSDTDTMGFTKVEMPATENGPQSSGPRQALPKGLVATRFNNYPASNSSRHPLSPSSTVTSSSFVECDLIDLGADISSPSRELSEKDVIPNARDGGDEADSSDDALLRREIMELRYRLKSTTARAEIAEEKVELAERRIGEIKSTVTSTITEIEKDTAPLASKINELNTENAVLKEQLRDAQSHIFSLQPYRKELTPEEVGREYDDLVEGISDWVSKFMDPYLDDHEKGVEDLMTAARRRPSDALKLKQVIHQYPDLVHGAVFPETDEDIIIATIMRFINENIFQNIMYGSIANYVEVLSFVETALQNHVDPKRDLFAIRTWTAEAYNAILSSRDFKGCREKKLRELTIELASVFKIFCRRDKIDSFFRNFEQICIKPAMQLYEKIQVSTNHFYFDINPYIVWGADGEMQTSTDFLDNLQDLDCKNIVQNRKAFNLAKIDPPPTKKELYHHLLNVCTLTPALYMRQIGRKDVIKEPQLVRRQRMLVAWGPQEKRDRFQENGDRTLLSHLYYAKSDRERQEAGGWTNFRWGG